MKKNLDKKQIAVIETAKQFLLRKERIQYADTRFTSSEYPESIFTFNEYRWESRGINGENKKNPEDYTSKDLGYTNCADFVHDVYHTALDYDFALSTTERFTIEARKPDSKITAFHYEITGTESEEEQARIINEYRKTLKPADIVILRNDEIDKGHAMLYVGKDQCLLGDAEVIHSTGKVYKYDLKKEQFEEEGTILVKNLDFYFVKSDSGKYLFDTYKSFSIIRPLNDFRGKIPSQTKNRIKNLKGIIAEKLSTPSLGQTVSIGDNITFSFVITNTTDQLKKIKINDVIPSNCVLVNSDLNFKHKNGKLSAKIKLQPKKIITLSYVVKVKDGNFVHGLDGEVGGVKTNCRKIYIKNTLNSNEQNLFISAIKDLSISNPLNLSGIDIINGAYIKALNKKTKLAGSFLDILFNVYKKIQDYAYEIDKDSKFYNLLVPSIYGGRLVKTSSLFDGYRTRLVYPNQLIIGDVIIAKEKLKTSICEAYVFAGENLYQINDIKVKEVPLDLLETLNAYDFFTVLRPSMDFVK